MGNNGLIDPGSGFGPACYFSRWVQCPAAALVAYNVQKYCCYNKPSFNWIHLQQG